MVPFPLVEYREDFETAFEAFNQIHQAGGQFEMVIEQSRLLGEMSTGQHGLDPEDVKQFEIQAKRLEILSFDVDRQVDEAREYAVNSGHAFNFTFRLAAFHTTNRSRRLSITTR